MNCPKCRSANNDDSRFCAQCAAPLQAEGADSRITAVRDEESWKSLDASDLPASALDLKSGTVFADRYRVIEELGHGGMGRVYKAYDAEIEETVGLKLIKPEITADRSTIERFQNELKLARRISHKNVCRLYHFSRSNGTYYITMEYVQGENLKQMIRMTQRLNPATAVAIARQLCAGLEEAHRLGIVHRDLKSSNIMIDREGTARIMDFGLARSIGAKGKTGAGTLVGTPEYMSPEQVEARGVDQRSDIYSLGVILYEMVTGTVPFKGDTPLHTAVKHKTESPSSPSRINAMVPEDLSRIILKCLEKDRNRRYQNTQEMLADLTNIENEMSSSIIPLSTEGTRESGSWMGRLRSIWKTRWWLFAAAFLVVAAVRVALLLSEGTGAPVPGAGRVMLAVLPFENLGPSEDEYFADGLTEEITSRLSLLHGLGVTSRPSAQHYKGTDKSTRQIGEELGVDYVLEGSVRWERGSDGAGRVRITPQLIRVADDTHIWSEIYERVLEDIFALQTEIAGEVIRNLDLVVLEPERQALAARGTDNLEAYDCYLRGGEEVRRGWSTVDRDAYLEAVELLERAVMLDPGFVAAYLSLAHAHQMVHHAGIDRSEGRLEQARAALERAEALAPDSPYVKIGWAFHNYRALLDYERALELYREVQQALPNYRTPVIGYILRRQGRWEESLTELEEVFRHEPRDPDLPCQIGLTYAILRRYAEAEEWYRKSIDIRPDYFPPRLYRAEVPLLASGDIDATEARFKALEQDHPSKDYMRFYLAMCRRDYSGALEVLGDVPGDAFFGFNFYLHKSLTYAEVYHMLGQFELQRFHAEAARIALEDVAERQPNDARVHAALGMAYAYLGRKEEAVQEGLRAVELEPVSLDAASGPEHVMYLTLIYTLVGEYDQAIERLEYLLSIPAGSSVTKALLEIEPFWDPLRDLPGFQRLLVN
ncbi:MAG: protein kinase [Candidatus Aminicenantaceae bacterium]